MTVFDIEYHYPADSPQVIELPATLRECLGKLKEEGKLIGSGPYTDGDGDALIVIHLADSATIADAEALMADDPFHTNNALTGRVFHTWNPVLNIFGV